jgi:hypothetical protein
MALIKHHLFPVLFVFILTICALLPSAFTLPQHPDEEVYAWAGGYYTNKLLHFDFSPTGSDLFTDPGWSPWAYWPLTGTMGPRYIYGIAQLIAGTSLPTLPYSWTDEALQIPETSLSVNHLLFVRCVSTLMAALGAALIALRLRWIGFTSVVLLLLDPLTRDDLSRAWSEGMLLFGIGLCVISYGTRWAGIANGVAVACKLTAVGFWLLLLWPKLNKHPIQIGIAWITWIVLTPQSWFAGGPIYLVTMVLHRSAENSSQAVNLNALEGTALGGIFLAHRYFWPVELLFAGLLVYLLVHSSFWGRATQRLSGLLDKNKSMASSLVE